MQSVHKGMTNYHIGQGCKKPNPVGFIKFFWLNPHFGRKPNLTGSGISTGVQLLE